MHCFQFKSNLNYRFVAFTQQIFHWTNVSWAAIISLNHASCKDTVLNTTGTTGVVMLEEGGLWEGSWRATKSQIVKGFLREV